MEWIAQSLRVRGGKDGILNSCVPVMLTRKIIAKRGSFAVERSLLASRLRKDLETAARALTLNRVPTYSSASAIFSARSNSASLDRAKDPTNRVSCTLRRLTRLSQKIQLSCFKPSSIPTATWVEKPCPRVKIGAQMTVGNRESISTWRLTTTKLR